MASVLQYFTNAGIPLNGGKVNTYLAGTSTPQATYTDSTGGTPNGNPIILDSAGRLPSVSIWQPGGVALKIILTDSSNNPLGPTFDQVSGINDPAATLTTLANANTGFGADLVANAMRSYDLMASLRSANAPSLSAGQTLVIDLQGGTTVNDSLAGLFFWSASSSAADDGKNVIKPNSVSGAGRYLRQQITGSFTGTLTGMTLATTGTVQYRISNNVVTLFFQGASISGISNSTSMTMTGLPSAVWPVQARAVVDNVTDNSITYAADLAVVGTSGTITFNKLSTGIYLSTGFTNSGIKGLFIDWIISYPIN